MSVKLMHACMHKSTFQPYQIVKKRNFLSSHQSFKSLVSRYLFGLHSLCFAASSPPVDDANDLRALI